MYGFGIAFDPVNAYLYVTGTPNLTVIDGKTDTVAGWVPVGGAGHGIAFDSANEDIYVSGDANNITVIDGATNQIVAKVPLGAGKYPGGASGIAFDSSNGRLYVANYYSGDVTVIDGATNTVVADIRIGTGAYPAAIAFDSLNGRVYVANGGYDNLTVIDGATDRIVAWIPVPGRPLVAQAMASPPDGVVPLTVSFTEIASGGLPPYSYRWDFGDGTNSTVQNPTHTYRVADVYLATLTVTDSENQRATNSVAITAKPSATTVILYAATFTETGLPQGTAWSVTLGNDTRSSTANVISFSKPNGTYPFTVASVSEYAASPSSGSLTVSGKAANASISFKISSSTFLGLPAAEGYALLAAIVIAAVGIAVVYELRRGRWKRGNPPG